MEPRVIKASQVEIDTKQELLQLLIANYFDSKSVVNPYKFARGKKTTKGLAQILGGKEGLMRGAIMGKRDNFTARGVITPDDYLHWGQVGVPEFVAKRQTFKECVNKFNIKRLTEMVKTGPNKLGGALSIVDERGDTYDLRFCKLQNVKKCSKKGILTCFRFFH